MRFILVVYAMTLSGCHFCADEMFAIMSVFGSIGLIGPWLKARWNGVCVKHAAKYQKHECGKVHECKEVNHD